MEKSRKIKFALGAIAAALAMLLGTGAMAANDGEPKIEQCLDPEICPIPYVRLAKQETEPFLFIGKVVDEGHPQYSNYKSALRRFPDVRSCMTTDERENPQPDLRQTDWGAIGNVREIEVCVFRVASSVEGVETIRIWLDYHGFSVSKKTRLRHETYVPKSKTDRIFSLEATLSMGKFREIIPRSWFAKIVGLEIGRRYALYLYFSTSDQVVGVKSSLDTKLNK